MASHLLPPLQTAASRSTFTHL